VKPHRAAAQHNMQPTGFAALGLPAADAPAGPPMVLHNPLVKKRKLYAGQM
jgi:hypothetical protein